VRSHPLQQTIPCIEIDGVSAGFPPSRRPDAIKAGWRDKLCDDHLHDDFGDFAAADHRGVRILGKKDDEMSRLYRVPRCGGVLEELNIPFLVEISVRLHAIRRRPPSELLTLGNKKLDVDMPAMGFESRRFAGLGGTSHKTRKNQIPVDGLSRFGSGIEVACLQIAEGLSKAGMNRQILRPRGKCIHDHAMEMPTWHDDVNPWVA